MALDVHLRRDGGEQWGFEILGGTDEMPLRVDKVQPNTAADKAGLQNDDTIISINGAEAIDMMQEDARRVVAECGGSLKLGVMRGLYDPVLDDQEPICEPYPPDGSDQPSGPTEVPFKIQQFIDAPEPLTFLEPPPFEAPPPFTTSRSLTSSPFVVPAKPYRPFSTEPLEIPLEDPIILNPNYKDQFGFDSDELKPDELLSSYYKDPFEKVEKETKFKLPRSEKYDPEGRGVKIGVNIEKTFKYIEFKETRDVSKETATREVINEENTTRGVTAKNVDAKNVTRDVKNLKDQHISSAENNLKELEEEMVREELKYIEKMKQEIDLDKIEETALSVVDESIERAVSVAEEIKKAIDEEYVDEKRVYEKKISSENNEIKSENDREFITTEDFKEVEYKVESNETNDADDETREIKPDEDADVLNNKREDNNDKVRRESRIFESKSERKMSTRVESVIKPTLQKEEYKSHEEINMKEQQSTRDRVRGRVTEPKIENHEYEARETKNEFSKVTSDAEQRIYSIGLQTIPNIRGVVTSSYHYDLLLKTFFIHLTDVMVALSRFILTQPVFNNEREMTDTKMYESGVNQVKRTVESNEKRIQKVVEQKPAVVKQRIESKIEKDAKVQSGVEKKTEQIVKPVPVKVVNQENIQKDIQQKKVESTKVEKESKQESQKETIKKEATVDIKKDMRVEKDLKQNNQESKTLKDTTETTEKRKISGSSMAQLSEKKLSQDLTQKMDAVMAEFQTKAAVDSIDMNEVKKQMMERRRRSRSRSQVEEEVMRESDPLEWLDKVDSRRASQERTEVRKEFSSTSESYEKKKYESNYERRETRRMKQPKQMYIAIVESHVFTNKDAIFEEQVSELSETSSVQSAEEVNTAFEEVQMETSENVAIENAINELETAKTVVQENHLDIASSKREATVEMIKEMVHDTNEIKDYKVSEEKATVKNEIQDVLVQESREVIEPVIDIQETKYEKVNIDINQSLTTAESEEININETKQDITNIEEVKKETVSIIEEDYRESAVKTELMADDFTEVTHAQQVESKYEVVKPEYQIVEGEEVTERVVIKSDKDRQHKVMEASAELKIVKEVEIESQAEIIEIEDENELVTESGVDAQSVINKLQILKALEMDESENITEKSIVTSEFDSNVSNNMAVIKQDCESISQSEASKLDQSVVQAHAQLEAKQENTSAVSLKNETHAQSEMTQAVSKFESSQSAALELESKSFTKSEMINKSSSNKIEQEIQQSSITAKSVDKKLILDTETAINRQISVQSDENNNIDTPTPSTVPPTPLIDNYVFRLTIPLPKSRGSTPVPRDCTPPNEEDPHIVKKKLIPHIETTIESVIYDPPLPTPPGSKVQSPVYSKPGLRGGCVYIKPGLRGGSDRPHWKKKEEIREIERKSSLLASAIDETIKSIEEYKEEFGIDAKKDFEIQEFKSEKVTKTFESSYSKEVTTQNGTSQFESKFDESINETEEKIQNGDTGSKESGKKLDIEVSKSDLVTKTQLDANTEEFEANLEDSKTEKAIEVESSNSDNRVDSQDVAVVESDSITKPEELESSKVENKLADSNSVEITEDSENIDIKSSQKTELLTEIKELPKAVVPEAILVEDKEKSESLPGFRPVVFEPEAIPKREMPYLDIPQFEQKQPTQDGRQSPYLTDTGDSIGTIQGIVDGLEEVVIDDEVAKELGKPGIPEEKIAELISGESEMLREAHVMGLSRVINSHMHRIDDSSVDFQKIKPMIDSLKDSEVLKALNEELAKAKELEKKKEEKKWTKFLQKPKRPVPRATFGYHGWTAPEQEYIEEPYKVKIVRQPKPKIAPDYKPEDFDTGPLPWEERLLIEESLPPIEPEDPILIPEEGPEFLEAVDPLPESEVPDLEDTGIPLPPVQQREPTPPITQVVPPVLPPEEPEEEVKQEELVEEREESTDMDNRLAEQLVRNVKSMVDPNATLEQQLAQMRAQLAALAQLPEVIQQTLELVTRQLSQISKQEANKEFSSSQTKSEKYQHVEVTQNHDGYPQEESQEVHKEVSFENPKEETHQMNGTQESEDKMIIEEMAEDQVRERQNFGEEKENVGVVQEMYEEKISEKQKKDQFQGQPTPRAPRKPQPKFGPLSPEQRAVVLPGGRRWRKTEDVYNEQLIAETLSAQAELIQGKALGFESEHLPYDSRINFMKYEKPPVSLDHLQNSEVYKLIHNMDDHPLKRVELRTPVIAEADYRERCRSMTPSVDKKNHLVIPQQFHP